jgi:hypothetical protein
MEPTIRVMMMSSFLRKSAALLSLLAGFAISSASQTPDSSNDYQVKAAYLLNFTRFIEWPSSSFADAASPMAICIYGKDPFGSLIDVTVDGQTVNSRKLIVRRVPELPDSQPCHVVFVAERQTGDRQPGEKPGDLPATLASLGSGVLTVGEGENFLHDGGMIAFVLENQRVRFDIAQSTSEKADLKLSSKLLSVARVVEK